MAITHSRLTVERNGRTVAIQTVNAATRYDALVAFGVSSGRAAAVAANVVTIRMKASE